MKLFGEILMRVLVISLAAELRWRGRPRLPRGEAVRLEFRAREADLFGFGFRDVPN